MLPSLRIPKANRRRINQRDQKAPLRSPRAFLWFSVEIDLIDGPRPFIDFTLPVSRL
jgi:hypothetical protein